MKKILIITLMATLILLYDKVDASTLTQEVSVFDSKVVDYTNNDLTQDILYEGKLFESSQDQQYYAWNITNYNYANEIDYIEIPLMLSFPNQVYANTTNTIYGQDYCYKYECTTWDSHNECLEYTCDRVNQGQNSQIVDREYYSQLNLTGMNIGFYAHNTDGGYSMCQIQNNYLMCPTRQRDIDFIGMMYHFKPVSSSVTQNIKISLGTVWNRYKANSATQAIQDQTQQQQQNYDGFMNSNQTYADQQDTNMRGVNETMEFEQAESQLIDSLDMNTSIIDEIIINPEASVFIWNIVEVLRSMNPAIILLMGSMLGMGILKLVLNR